MNTTTVLLVRHGQTRSNVIGHYMGWIDEDLSEEGVRQAEQLSHRLAGWPINSAYSSPLQRAYRTAGMVAAPHSLPVSTLQGLGEMRIGTWEGMPREEVKARFPDLWRAWRKDPSSVQVPDGETIAQVRERAVDSFENIIEANRGHQVLVVTHEVIVKLLVAYCLDTGNSIYRRLMVANASLTIIEIINGRQLLHVLNDTAHLEAAR